MKSDNIFENYLLPNPNGCRHCFEHMIVILYGMQLVASCELPRLKAWKVKIKSRLVDLMQLRMKVKLISNIYFTKFIPPYLSGRYRLQYLYHYYFLALFFCFIIFVISIFLFLRKSQKKI